MPAEIVLRSFRIELVEDEIWLAGEDAQIRLRRRVPERSRPTTDRAVAINSVIELGASLECDPTTVARALVGLGHLIRGLTFAVAAPYEARSARWASVNNAWFGPNSCAHA